MVTDVVGCGFRGSITRQNIHVVYCTTGHIKALWITSQAKRDNPHQPTQDDINHQAQLAADEDNYHTAYARLTKAMPVADMTRTTR